MVILSKPKPKTTSQKQRANAKKAYNGFAIPTYYMREALERDIPKGAIQIEVMGNGVEKFRWKDKAVLKKAFSEFIKTEFGKELLLREVTELLGYIPSWKDKRKGQTQQDLIKIVFGVLANHEGFLNAFKEGRWLDVAGKIIHTVFNVGYMRKLDLNSAEGLDILREVFQRVLGNIYKWSLTQNVFTEKELIKVIGQTFGAVFSNIVYQSGHRKGQETPRAIKVKRICGVPEKTVRYCESFAPHNPLKEEYEEEL